VYGCGEAGVSSGEMDDREKKYRRMRDKIAVWCMDVEKLKWNLY